MQVEQMRYSYLSALKSLQVLLTIAVAHATEELSPTPPRYTQTQYSRCQVSLANVITNTSFFRRNLFFFNIFLLDSEQSSLILRIYIKKI